MKHLFYFFLFLILCSACSENDDVIAIEESYFPPIGSSEWETVDISEVGWNENKLNDLYTFLEQNNTRAFIVLKNGRIVIEKYWGTTIANTSAFNQNSVWYWASAGKTLTATLTGIAQEQGFLSIQDKTSDYLGVGWTALAPEQESLIRIYHQLTMTTGLDYNVPDLNCTHPNCLNFKEEAGSQWFYHNAPYTLIQEVISNASNLNYNEFTDLYIENYIGMNGNWITNNASFNSTYWSTARDMARFGLLIANNGKWEDTQVIEDQNYFNDMISTSQALNPSYGYLWWLNGKDSIIVPGLPNTFSVPLSNNAPEDLFAGMGKNGQYVEVIPSMDLVVVRMGEAPEDSLVPIQFHNQMWDKINGVIDR